MSANGQTALVTGASSGIGLELAKLLARRSISIGDHRALTVGAG